MTREEIKQLLTSKGFDVNVRLEGDQKNFKVTIKSSFLVPVENINNNLILQFTKAHVKSLWMAICGLWYFNLGT
jgi:acid stress-induced BolA-like protein IbaG/YrbA